MEPKYILAVTLLAVYLISGRRAVSMFDLNYLMLDQGPSIYELSQIVKSDPVTASYHYGDYDLAKWLAENDFDVAKAFEKIRANVFWRMEERMDTILSEGFQDMSNYFPYTMDSYDREGRPVVYMNAGNWDVNRYAVNSEIQKNRFIRYLLNIMEQANVRVKQLYSQGYRNVTQFSLILNLEGFSVEQHGSLEALSLFGLLSNQICNNYPMSTERIIFVNTPYIFSKAYGFLNDDVQKVISVLDHPSVYEPALVDYLGLDNIPRDLLPLKTYQNGAQCKLY